MVVAGINVLIWLAAHMVVGLDTTDASVMAMVALLYGGLLAILIGALASAEERRLGTLEWQALLPVAAWRQFAMKTGVALTLSLLLSFALPLLLARGELAVTAVHAGAVLLLTTISLYVSSRCDSGLQALAMAVTTLFLISLMAAVSVRWVMFSRDTVLVMVGVVVVMALRLASVNHRTARS